MPPSFYQHETRAATETRRAWDQTHPSYMRLGTDFHTLCYENLDLSHSTEIYLTLSMKHVL